MKQKSSPLSWRWFHILPVIVSFACMAGWGWLAKQSEVLNMKGSQPSLVDKHLKIIEHKLLRPAPKIFLLWTTLPGTFKERNYDVLEAYYYHHPDAEITIYASHLELFMFKRFTMSGYRLSVVNITDDFIHNISHHCPGKKWIEKLDSWKNGPYYYSHITDYVRFCLLYKNGGIYSDFDAILINPINEHDSFIGKDSSGAHGNCKWCFPGGDTYLAPGLMATSKGHSLPKYAIEIGFSESYDPLIFNQVGPMAVTKAFLQNFPAQKGIHVYEKDAFYPYNYLKSSYLIKHVTDPLAKLEKLRDHSLSLHLYGHKTRNLPIDQSSIIAKASQIFRVTSISPSMVKSRVGYRITTPEFIGVSNGVYMFGDVRILSVYDNDWKYDGSHLEVEVKAKYGSLFIAGASRSKVSTFNSDGPAKLNRQLSKLIYLAESGIGRDLITVKLQVYSLESINGPPQIMISEIPVYNVGVLSSVIVKTFGRMDKVFELVKSCKKMYPELNIIVSDDAENITKSEGSRKLFYYLPLPSDIGLSAGRNRMIEKVQTEYFLTLDDDFMCDSNSKIERLIHPLEIPDNNGLQFDIAAAKNPVDEDKFLLDFCGILSIRDRTLYLEEGTYGKHLECHQVDFVPNIFVGRTALFKGKLKWDESLKLGEHEDFFLRAKAMNVRVLTCPSVSFQHDQVEHWKGKTKYDKMRNRVYDFWKDSLRKHGLVRLVSFGTTMMDLVVPAPLTSIVSNPVFSRTLRLSWISDAKSFNIMVSRDNGHSFRYVNGGQGEGYEGGNFIDVFMLRPGLDYIFKIYAGNRFEYETLGSILRVSTITLSEENNLNIIQDPSFELGTHNFKESIGTFFHVIDNRSTIEGEYVGRIVIRTRSYLADGVTRNRISQVITDRNKLDDIITSKKNSHEKYLSLSVYSQLESCYFTQNDFEWGVYLLIEFQDGSIMKLMHSFDTSSKEWQGSLMTACLSKWTRLKSVKIVAHMAAKSCVSLWDGFVLV